MDLQRILILVGLAVTAYMLVLAWNEDYGSNGNSSGQAEQTQASEAPPAASLDDTVPELTQTEPTQVGATQDDIPELASPMPTTLPAIQEQNTQARLISVQTDVLHLLIDPLGGDVVSASLPAYPASLEAPDVPFRLIDARNTYVAQSGLIGPNGTDKSGARPMFTAPSLAYELGSAERLEVPLRHVQEDGTVITKRFLFQRSDYLVRVEYEVTNNRTSPWQAGLFVQIKRNGQEPFNADNPIMGMQPFVGGATRSDGELYRKLEFDDIESESYTASIADGYMAMVQHYFVTAWVPDGIDAVNYSARKLKGRDIYLFGYTTPAALIPPGSTGVIAANLYVGPKDQRRLSEIATGLDLTIDYGFLWWLAQPLFYLLDAIHSFLPNWGVAIIILTFFVKLLLYPLSAASFKSMAKMRRLQPEMARLKERFGDDRQKFSQAMMELYKKEGANPLGGCFPILLQMPVFLALYWTLLESVELRQAPFMLWIDDLSAMDPFFVLPILMGISMYLTQLMQPEPPDPIQAKVFKLMPVMFTFFFLWFPSGLVLYWLVNNLLSIAQQWYVTRQIAKQG